MQNGYSVEASPASPYFIHEEEVPRSGVVVNRTYQRVRWVNGKTYVWVGRQKQNGRGEGNSRLKFDQVSPKTSEV